LSDKEEDRESTSQSSVIPPLTENIHFLKGNLRAQFQCMTEHMSHNKFWPWFSRVTGATSPKLYVLVDRFTPLRSERDKGEKTAQFNWRAKNINLDLFSMERVRK
jgi:hypothetical protein